LIVYVDVLDGKVDANGELVIGCEVTLAIALDQRCLADGIVTDNEDLNTLWNDENRTNIIASRARQIRMSGDLSATKIFQEEEDIDDNIIHKTRTKHAMREEREAEVEKGKDFQSTREWPWQDKRKRRSAQHK